MRLTVHKEYAITEFGGLSYESTWKDDLQRVDGERVTVVLDDGTRFKGVVDAALSDCADLVLNTGSWSSDNDPIVPRQFAIRTGRIKTLTVNR